MGRLFGTDGVRGLANGELTCELALGLAVSAARVLCTASPDRRPRAVVGTDGRASGEMLQAAVAAGLASMGVDVDLVGVLPTPAVAFLTADTGADLGVMISASHNPMPDNGIKIFASGGSKLADEAEDAIEAALADTDYRRPTGAAIGRIRTSKDAHTRYVDHLLASLPHRLDGLKIVVDCANGAASAFAPEVYRAAGAEVHVIATEPDGWNINDGVGSTHMQGLQAAVLAAGADIGIAHDGDADRCLAVAGDGSLVSGDVILALLATGMAERGELPANTVVTTVMANTGFLKAMESAGITVRTTAVGDRYVLAEMNASGFGLGGEQSGHVIVSQYATTGDGLLSALHLMAHLAASGKSMAELAEIVIDYPQVLINVAVADKNTVALLPAVQAAVAEAEAELADGGRVLLRPSGTEPLVRVMVEASSAELAEQLAGRVAEAVSTAGA